MNDDAPSPPPPPAPPADPAPAAPAAAPTLFCISHRKVPAIFRCDRCGSCICATCVFELPGSRHLCPSCTSEGSKTFSRGRATSVRWSLGLAGFATLTMALLMFGAFASLTHDTGSLILLEYLLRLIVMLPAVIGMALAWGSHEKRLNNPTSLWVGLVWNAALVAMFILLLVIGLFSSG